MACSTSYSAGSQHLRLSQQRVQPRALTCLPKVVSCRPQLPALSPAQYQPGLSVPQRQKVLTRAVDVSAAIGVAGSLGIVAGTFFFALYTLEKEGKNVLENKLLLLKGQLSDKDADITKLQEKLVKEKEVSKESSLYRKRYEEGTKEIFKLERALEMKDAQIESFMLVAQRQIKLLEDRVKEVQKMY